MGPLPALGREVPLDHELVDQRGILVNVLMQANKHECSRMVPYSKVLFVLERKNSVSSFLWNLR